MEDLLIIGSGGQGREVVDAVSMINSLNQSYQVVGILDDNSKMHGQHVLDQKVLGDVGQVVEYPDTSIVVAVGNPKVKRLLVSKIQNLLDTTKFATVVHPKASVSQYADIGKGVIVAPGAIVSTSAVIGDHVLINYCASVGHDSQLHNFVSVQPGARVNGNSLISEGAYIGTNSALNEGVCVGEWSIIANGAAVTSDVPANVMVAGVPAIIKKKLS